jgi:hypothetical protein
VNDLDAASGGGFAAIATDMGTMGAALNAANISATDWMLFANAKQSKAAAVLAPTLPMLDSPALQAGNVVAMQPAAIVSGFTGVPEIETDGRCRPPFCP